MPTKKRVRPTINDQGLLDLLEMGTITVDLNTADVFKRGELLTATIVGKDGKNGTRYRLEIYHQERRRTIVRSRLVYMAGTMQLIPDKHEIHHLNGDRYDDRWANLICVSIRDHLKIHAMETEEDDEVPF